MNQEERNKTRHTTFEDLTETIQTTEGEIFLSISFAEGEDIDEE